MPVALLTDFGTDDYYVGAMKGVILGINPKAVIVDITHSIEPQNIVSAAFVLQSCYRDFPPATVFCCVIDPGVGSSRRALIVESNDQFFVGPDNELFSFILSNAASITSIESDQYFRKPVSSTFHGRDIFAPVSAHISLGVPPHEFGPQVSDPVTLPPVAITSSDGQLKATVIHIDHFGNIVTNLPSDEVPSSFTAEINGHQITRRCDTYADAPDNTPCLISGSAGFIEISIRNGSAAAALAVKTGDILIIHLN